MAHSRFRSWKWIIAVAALLAWLGYTGIREGWMAWRPAVDALATSSPPPASGLTPDVLDRLKAATVYIRVGEGASAHSGSGVLVRSGTRLLS